jgi:hypothetical protein
VWTEAKKVWTHWIKKLKEKKPACHSNRNATQPATWVYTDASLTGWGAVFFTNGVCFELQGRWETRADGTAYESKDINMLEMRAVQHAIAQGSTRLALGTTIHVIVDNTSIIHIARKGISPSFDCNEALKDVMRAARKAHIEHIAMSYVSTRDNPADRLSRIFEGEGCKKESWMQLEPKWAERMADQRAWCHMPLPAEFYALGIESR